MENASKALLIAGAILLAILIIAIGLFIYNSAQSTVNDSMTTMTTQEIEAFNNQFNSYAQTQTGSNVKALLGRLIANANTYTEEPGKVPDVVVYGGINAAEYAKGNTINMNNAGENNVQTYVDGLSSLQNKVENKHKYTIEFQYGSSGMIDEVDIKYEKDSSLK